MQRINQKCRPWPWHFCIFLYLFQYFCIFCIFLYFFVYFCLLHAKTFWLWHCQPYKVVPLQVWGWWGSLSCTYNRLRKIYHEYLCVFVPQLLRLACLSHWSSAVNHAMSNPCCSKTFAYLYQSKNKACFESIELGDDSGTIWAWFWNVLGMRLKHHLNTHVLKKRNVFCASLIFLRCANVFCANIACLSICLSKVLELGCHSYICVYADYICNIYSLEIHVLL